MKEDKVLRDLIDQINKKCGEGTLVEMDRVDKSKNVETFTTGLPSLDLILGGGIPKGRIIEIYGPESSGKSTLALHILSKAQAEGKKVAYIDAENAFDPEYAKALGIEPWMMLLNQPDSGEQALDITEKLCQSGKVSVIVIDSVACLIPMSVAAKEIDGTAHIGTTARLLSQTLPRIAKAAGKSGTSVIFINQIRMKIGIVYGNPETTPGGLALKFAASLRLDVRGKPRDTKEDAKAPQGLDVTIRVKKNKIAPPFRHTQLFLEYGKGFDATADLLDTAAGLGLIEKNGGWFQYGEFKKQGWNTFVSEVKQDAALLEEILTKVRAIKA